MENTAEWQADDGAVFTNCAVIFRVAERFGELSNMAGGYPLRIGKVEAPSSEALYQACRFPHQPEWQREILSQASPMAAKMKAKKDGRRANHSRPDWNVIVLDVMRWVLRVKLAQHIGRMQRLLESTGERMIVEQSRKDPFWGAVPNAGGRLVGSNQLGRLLMDLRAAVRTTPRAELVAVPSLPIPDFLLLGQPIS